MNALMKRDLPNGLYHLMVFWEAEEASPKIIEKICDGEISEEEEVKMFLEWCQEKDVQEEMSKEDKKDLQELLKMN